MFSMETRRAQIRKTKSNSYSTGISEFDSTNYSPQRNDRLEMNSVNNYNEHSNDKNTTVNDSASYGSKILNLIFSRDIYPTYEPTFAPLKDALRIHPGDKSNTSLYFSSNSNITNHWDPDTVFYNPDGNYSLVDEWEKDQIILEDDEVGYGNSNYMAGTILFNYSDPLSGNFLSCGLTDKWSNIIIGANGANTLLMSIPAVPILPQVLCISNQPNDNDTNAVVAPSDMLEPYLVSNPGDNFTLFGVNNQTQEIYARSIYYYGFKYRYYYLSTEEEFANDPLYFLESTFNSFDLNLSSTNQNAVFNTDNNKTSRYVGNNVTEYLVAFGELYYSQNVSFVLTFTLGKQLEGNLSSFGVMHNKVVLGYYRDLDTLTVTQSFYYTKKFIFEFDYNDNKSRASKINSKLIEQWGIHFVPVASNIKVSTFVYSVLSEGLDITVKGYDQLGFYYPGRVRYNATSIIIAIISVSLASLILFFLTKLILYKCPQGIPTYYGLLHEYYQNHFNNSRPYDPKVERESIFKIIDNAYEGVGYDRNMQRNRIGVLDEATIRTGTSKNGIVKRRIIQ
ncbi:uncharacterized protein SAPINGB_P002347 [Magnusiomyces paraingens]|uniref:Uncharacterized protein n=1 Tax=Magnusiomyces paraingens TaxID=2606893 RepID=A0A5E8BDF6_9ASCO|nr:uncharacterized protein SAPINGB_P002347 [Saprochaete ingens]VVT49595.1 unnamed protein product [Saprochaete ingens]